MSLEQLPPELHQLILESIESPRDLRHFLSASPACHRTYQDAPHVILSTIIRRLIPHQASLHHASAIRQATKLVTAPLPSDTTQHDLVVCFMDEYLAPHPFKLPDSAQELWAIWRLLLSAIWLSNDYFARASHELGVGTNTKPASTQERTRLLRGFLRFELYNVVVSIAEGNFENPLEMQDLLDTMISRLPSWEVEEMSCVNHYLTHRLIEEAEKVEHELVEEVLSLPGAQVPETPPAASGFDPPEVENYVTLNFLGLDMEFLDSEARSFWDLMFGGVASRGLNHVYDICTDGFLKHVYRETPRENSRYILSETLCRDVATTMDPVSSGTTAAWRHLRPRQYHGFYIPIYEIDGCSGTFVQDVHRVAYFRHVAWVFLDDARFTAIPATHRLLSGDNYWPKEVWDMLSRDTQAGPEERLRGVTITSSQWDYITDKYGDSYKNKYG